MKVVRFLRDEARFTREEDGEYAFAMHTYLMTIYYPALQKSLGSRAKWDTFMKELDQLEIKFPTEKQKIITAVTTQKDTNGVIMTDDGEVMNLYH